MTFIRPILGAICVFLGIQANMFGADPSLPRLVGHRGLITHAPENTLATFAACLHLRLGFELDVRRTSDGHLICLHDADLQRTIGQPGKVAEMTLAELKKFDAGKTFDPVYTGQRIPTLIEIYDLLASNPDAPVLVAIDLKVDDAKLASEVVQLAQDRKVLDRLVFIGLAITDAGLRGRLQTADTRAASAVLVVKPEDLEVALTDRTAKWVYLRWLPSTQQVQRIHQAGRRVFLSGSLVAGKEPEAWNKARLAGVDALLTDYPLDCRQHWRMPPKP